MCKKMYNDLCKICQVADSFEDCDTDFDKVVLNDITRNVVDCEKFKAIPNVENLGGNQNE